MIPNNIQELAEMMAKRDNLTIEEELNTIRMAALDMETAFYNGDLGLAEDILKDDLGLEPDYLMLFIN